MTMADTTEKTIAFELRKAAAKLRRTAGPLPILWVTDDYGDGVQVADAESGESNYVAEGVGEPYAAWMVLASPALAEPLASWLESAAWVAREHPQDPEYAGLPNTKFCTACQDEETTCVSFIADALAVARVLNGTTERTGS